ncbi:hypothetical protein AB0F77_27225 [Streptomyces sp. NPDC026672]|uniref:hypothetical protein n=1 Tax=unclassified Streptomyces TaxID=2593676 RepID=UPI0033F6C383
MGTAHASVAECTNDANGFVSIPYNKSGSVKTSVSLGRATVQLPVGPISGKDYGWAKITGSTVAGDQVWMDWTTTCPSSADSKKQRQGGYPLLATLNL